MIRACEVVHCLRPNCHASVSSVEIMCLLSVNVHPFLSVSIIIIMPLSLRVATSLSTVLVTEVLMSLVAYYLECDHQEWKRVHVLSLYCLPVVYLSRPCALSLFAQSLLEFILVFISCVRKALCNRINRSQSTIPSINLLSHQSDDDEGGEGYAGEVNISPGALMITPLSLFIIICLSLHIP